MKATKVVSAMQCNAALSATFCIHSITRKNKRLYVYIYICIYIYIYSNIYIIYIMGGCLCDLEQHLRMVDLIMLKYFFC